MGATRCYLGLGANLGDPAAQLLAAVAALGRLPQTRLVARSPLYRSAAIGPGPQPDYCNAACAIDTELAPEDLLAHTQALETAAGRVRDPRLRWTARPLDIDLLLYGDRAVASPALTLPHPRMHDRPFVLAPLRDIAPALCLPDGRAVRALLAACGHDGLTGWAQTAGLP